MDQTTTRPAEGRNGSRTVASAAEVTASFHKVFGGPPDAVWAAPGRVNLIGEHLDLNESFVLPIAVQLTTSVAARRRPDRKLVLCSLWPPGGGEGDGTHLVPFDLDGPEHPSGWTAYPIGVALELEAGGYPLPGADILVASDLPVGAGLSSSAALECATGAALCDLAGLSLTPLELARFAQRAEHHFANVPCGLMDQVAAMCCEEDRALLFDTRSLQLRALPFDLPASGLELLVVDTRVSHALASSGYADRRDACLAGARALGVRALRDVPPDGAGRALATVGAALGDVARRRVRHVFTEQARVLAVAGLLQQGKVAEIGPLLYEGHDSLRDDFEVSVPELDAVVEVAAACGAHGARMTGGGFGGSAIVLVDSDKGPALVDAVQSRFAEVGYAEPGFYWVRPSHGARRIAS